MRLKYLLYLTLIFSVNYFNACKCNTKQQGEKEQVYLYSFEKTPALTADHSKQLISDYLGIKDIHDLTLNKDENAVYFVSDTDVNTTFEQNLNNGNFEFNKSAKEYGNVIPKLPSKDEAVKIAESFMKSKNIFPGNESELRLVHNGGVREQAVINGQKAGPVIDKLITLTYSRTIDSLPVIGAGSKIIINIGDKGEIVGLNRRWRELNKSSAKQLTTPEVFTQSEAQEQAKQQIQTEFGQAPYEIRSSVKSYYDNNGNYLQPVWAFNVMVYLNRQDKNVQPVKYLCIIPMLKNTPEQLRLNAIDPRAKEMIRTITPNSDSMRNQRTDEKNND
ncbi:MAG: hypothetical protein QM763_14070 [Agriterribacter sp.]